MAARQAAAGSSPAAISRPAITSSRVLAVSSRSWSVRRRSAPARLTSERASAGDTPLSAATIASSSAGAG